MSIKIIGQASGATPEVETGTLAERAIIRNNDISFGGSYSWGSVATSALNASTSSQIFWRAMYLGTGIALIKRVTLSVGVFGANQTAGGSSTITLFKFQGILYTGSAVNAAFELGDSKVSKYCSACPSSQMIISTVLPSPGIYSGTEVVDAQPFGSVVYSWQGTSGQGGLRPHHIYDHQSSMLPFTLSPYEGIQLYQISTVSQTTVLWPNVAMMWEEYDSAS